MNGFVCEARPSDSPYVETVTQGRTAGKGTTIRPAEVHWHMVFVTYQGHMQSLAVGPLTTAGVVPFTAGAEILWIKFRLGAFMPHLPASHLLDTETALPSAAGASFWLNGSAWQFPTYENADVFVNRLAREGVLAHDPMVNRALQDLSPDVALRTVRHRFKRATGQTQSHIRQFERAHRAAARLQEGASILDTVCETGYSDQSHLTKSLKQFTGYTPAQLLRLSQSA